ncbi:hypothetical protein AB0J09_48905, partial [Nonomuraea sp. NPDC049784]
MKPSGGAEDRRGEMARRSPVTALRRLSVAWGAGAAGAVSLAVTLAHPLTGRVSDSAPLLVGEVSVLLVLTAVTVRRSPGGRAVVSAGLSGLAVALILLRAVWQGPAQLMFGACAGWALGAVAAAGVGLYLRGLDDKRQRAVEEATRA